ncbi:binding-protein-dependent transport systems inner membrane component [Haloferax elongans ATCC BAA-1513]|uniref:Binding-protein-dependent transport systems inner membrane component n=1 Tax=Haloferax elongans ATCC BAA-1513 TaxID=1230453 RepID=M0HNG8_HALEO|nr:ABC transporter permease [Haloferax elongans]ELZ84649.1 binding-protein-dependent transport systems inner membrane component [Haloferax elongans ATCC BAA-1513]
MAIDTKHSENRSVVDQVGSRVRWLVAVYRRLDLSAQVSFWIVAAISVAAAAAPLITPYAPGEQLAITADPALKLHPPTPANPMGTDLYGRDVFTRLVYGARSSLAVGLLAVGIAATIGITAGSIAGYVGGWVDESIMRVMDILISFPALVLAITLVGALGSETVITILPVLGELLASLPVVGSWTSNNIINVIFVIGLVYSPQIARVTRGEVLRTSEEEFVEAAENTGLSRVRILVQHILPNSMAPVLVQSTFLVATAILFEASLSYLGLGVQPPIPTWGVMISNGQGYLPDSWWWTTFPGLAIMVTVLALNLLGDGLRDEFDPRSATDGGPN